MLANDGATTTGTSDEANGSMTTSKSREERAHLGEGLSEAEQTRLAQAVMRKQLTLSIRVALLFFVLLFGLPLVNWLLPEFANSGAGGFTLTWLFLGILFYPLTWLLSGYFIRASDRIEAELVREHRMAPHGKEEGER
jgi:uncharacterized membrane protein (DUF485 family)